MFLVKYSSTFENLAELCSEISVFLFRLFAVKNGLKKLRIAPNIF
jgi:hypothetical protein